MPSWVWTNIYNEIKEDFELRSSFYSSSYLTIQDGNFNKKLKLQDQSRKYWAYHQEQIEKAEGGN